VRRHLTIISFPDVTHLLDRRHSALSLGYSLALLVTVSCKGTEPVPISLTGSWYSTVAGVNVDPLLRQSGTQLSGSVFFHDWSNDALGGCDVTGTYIEPSVTLIFPCSKFGPARFDGHTIDARSITGTMIWGDGREYSSFKFELRE
jgi:hypothetical protein